MSYAPIEREALVLAWSLEHWKLFTIGCENLISTDHHPLLGIFISKELNSIKNPWLCNLKEKSLKFSFNMQYNPGKWHRGPDAYSKNPILPAPKLPEGNPICCILAEQPTDTDIYMNK